MQKRLCAIGLMTLQHFSSSFFDKNMFETYFIFPFRHSNTNMCYNYSCLFWSVVFLPVDYQYLFTVCRLGLLITYAHVQCILTTAFNIKDEFNIKQLNIGLKLKVSSLIIKLLRTSVSYTF